MKPQTANIQIHGFQPAPAGRKPAKQAQAGPRERPAARGGFLTPAQLLKRWSAALGETKRLKTLSMITRQMAIMTRAGTPLVMAVGGCVKQVNDERWQRALENLQHAIEEGQPMADAMRHNPDCFDTITCALVAAGEQSGRLPEMLQRLSDLSQKQLRIRNGITGAMVYPVLLIAIVSVVFTVTLTAVVPRFEKMFASLNAPLPPTTQALVWASAVLRDYWWGILPLTLLAVAGFGAWMVTPAGRLTLDRWSLKLPVFGPLAKSVATTKIIRLLAELIDSHLPLLDVLRLVKQSTGNHLYAQLVGSAEHAVTQGESMSLAFNDDQLIHASVYEAMKSGEASGKTSQAMLALADFLEEDNDQVIRSLTTLLEPAILLFLGLVVAVLAISLFLPLFDLSAIAGDGGQP